MKKLRDVYELLQNFEYCRLRDREWFSVGSKSKHRSRFRSTGGLCLVESHSQQRSGVACFRSRVRQYFPVGMEKLMRHINQPVEWTI